MNIRFQKYLTKGSALKFNLKFSFGVSAIFLAIGNLRSNKQSQDRFIQFFLLCLELTIYSFVENGEVDI